MSEYLAQKHTLYAQVGRVSRALGQKTRLEIIEILAQAPRSVETIASLLQTDIKSVSQHLQVLVETGLLTVERKGRFRWYAVRCQEVLQLAVLLRTTAETLLGAPQTDVKDELSLSEGLSLARQGRLAHRRASIRRVPKRTFGRRPELATGKSFRDHYKAGLGNSRCRLLPQSLLLLGAAGSGNLCQAR